MLRYVLASHGELARGMCDSVRMLLGESVELWPVCAYVQADEPISEQIERLLHGFLCRTISSCDRSVRWKREHNFCSAFAKA